MFLRYTASGGIMLIWALASGAHVPRGRELWRTAIYGLSTIGIGTGCLSIAEQWVPSGMAALIVTAVPFWMVGIEALTPGGQPLHAPTIRGMLVGLAGVAFLLAPSLLHPGAGVQMTSPGLPGGLLGGFLLQQVGCIGWSVGSLAQRRQASRAHPFVSGAIQQLASGLVYAIPAALQSRPAQWTPRGIGALAYLAVFGGIVGFSAYVYAMSRLPVPVASIYNYINPLVAVWLGWLFYREQFGWQEAAAMVIIFAGVAMVKRASSSASASVPVQDLRADSAAEGG